MDGKVLKGHPERPATWNTVEYEIWDEFNEAWEAHKADLPPGWDTDPTPTDGSPPLF